MQATVSDERTASPLSDSLPKRDYFLLPLVSLLTIILLIVIAEGVARLVWAEQPVDACVYYDHLGWVRHRPGCSNSMKNLEGPWVRYQYNDCGYRGKDSCGPKPANAARFAIMGTSIAFGMYVPEKDLFYNRAAPALQRILGRPVQFENLGTLGPDLGFQDQMIDEIAKLHPNGVFFVIVPFDLKRLDEKPLWVVEKREMHGHGLFDLSKLAYLGRSSRAFFLAQHYILSQPDFAVRAFQMKSDPDDPAHIPGSAVSEKRFERLDGLIQRLSTGFRSRGIVLYVVPLPSRLQAALIGKNAEIPGVDPLAFSRRVAEMSSKAGAQCIDTSPEFKHTPDPERAYYPVDGHLDAFGNKLVADAIVNYFVTHGRSGAKQSNLSTTLR